MAAFELDLPGYRFGWRQLATAIAAVALVVAALVALVESDPVLSDPRCDLQACTEPASTPGQRLLAGRAAAVLSVAGASGAYAALPAHACVAGAAPAVAAALAA